MTAKANVFDPARELLNFRDLGGMVAGSGRRVRSGMLYRSGQPGYRHPREIEALAQLGIATVCDFRSDAERASDPAAWMEQAGIAYLVPNRGRDVGDPVTTLLRATIDAETTREMMHDVYRGIAFAQQASFASLFARLLAAPAPVLFHCASGKDRTGAFAALLLTVLGVPRKTIVADFAVSDAAIDGITRQFAEDARHAPLTAAPAHVWGPMMEADPGYLGTFFTTLEERFGSLGEFVDQELGVDPAAQAELRRIYLTETEGANGQA